MSTQRKPEFTRQPPRAAPVSEASVHDYLKRNPDFFERHSSLLGALRLPHVTGGAVSLVERQVSVLRQKDLRRERKLKELLEVARVNDTLAGKIHQLALRLLGTKDVTETLDAVEETLRTAFDADSSVLVLFAATDTPGLPEGRRFARPLKRDDAALRPFATFLGSSRPRCGQVRDSQREFLFGNEADAVGSAALVPLGPKCRLGFLAIGSVDANRFHPGMSFDFLARLGELVAGALARYV